VRDLCRRLCGFGGNDGLSFKLNSMLYFGTSLNGCTAESVQGIRSIYGSAGLAAAYFIFHFKLPVMSNKLEILKKSLSKKEQELQLRFGVHFATVKEANGQPLNDKRNGQATLAKWERQNDAIRTAIVGIEKTKRAIDVEEGKIAGVDHANRYIPKEILELVESGELIQWRKYPHTFFVAGVDKARIVWLEKTKQLAHKFVREIKDQEQRSKFVKVFNPLSAVLNRG
jgi:hypothetical protein